MKKNVLSILLCVAMIASMFTMMASAVTQINVDVSLINSTVDLLVGTKEASIKPKDYISIKNRADNTAVTYDNFATYYDITASIVGDTLTFGITAKDKNTEADGTMHYTIGSAHNTSATLTADIKWVSGLYDMTLGVRLNGTNGANLGTGEVGEITATVTSADGSRTTSSVVDKLFDLSYEEKVNLTVKTLDAYKDYYEFFCWIDGSGNVVSKNATVECTVTENCAMYAVYREKCDRTTIDVSSSHNGYIYHDVSSMVINGANGSKLDASDDTLGHYLKTNHGADFMVFDSASQVSVFKGSSQTFYFVPDEGYEVSKVVVNGDEISNIRNLITKMAKSSSIAEAVEIFGQFSDATSKDAYTYTFTNVDAPSSIYVEFSKSTVYEPAEGVTYVEGPELSTGDYSENAAEVTDAEGNVVTTLPAEDTYDGTADVANPATGSTTAIAVFATLSIAAAAAFVTAKKKH